MTVFGGAETTWFVPGSGLSGASHMSTPKVPRLGDFGSYSQPSR